jgi:hypothetical protein
MPFGLGLRDIVALARESQRASHPAAPIVVSGPRASEVADGLARDGDDSLVRVGGEPTTSAAYVVVLDRPADAVEEGRLREATRGGIPVLAVRLGDFDGRPPYVLPGDVIDVADRGGPLPVDAIAEGLAAALGERGVALASRLPVLRPSVERRRTLDSALGAASLVAFARGEARPLLPVLALAQARTLRQLSVARGESVPSAPAGVATTVGPELAAALAVGLVCRTLVRRLPVRGRLVEGAIAGAGTFALAAVARRTRR